MSRSQECICIIPVIPTQPSAKHWGVGMKGSCPSCFRPPSHLCLHLNSGPSRRSVWFISAMLSDLCPWTIYIIFKQGQPLRHNCAILAFSHRVTSDSFCHLLISSGHFCPIHCHILRRIHCPPLPALPQAVPIFWL